MFAKRSILDVRQGSEYASASCGEKRYKGCLDRDTWQTSLTKLSMRALITLLYHPYFQMEKPVINHGRPIKELAIQKR